MDTKLVILSETGDRVEAGTLSLETSLDAIRFRVWRRKVTDYRIPQMVYLSYRPLHWTHTPPTIKSLLKIIPSSPYNPTTETEPGPVWQERLINLKSLAASLPSQTTLDTTPAPKALPHGRMFAAGSFTQGIDSSKPSMGQIPTGKLYTYYDAAVRNAPNDFPDGVPVIFEIRIHAVGRNAVVFNKI